MPTLNVETEPSAAQAIGRLDVEAVRRDFPCLHQEVNGRPLAYLDNAASAQTPRAVLGAMESFYTRDYANVHRGVHTLSGRATDRYEAARETARRFLGAPRAEEIVFVRGATEGINLVARSFVRPRLEPGDEVVVTGMEHHSNIVPWQLVCAEAGARLRPVRVDDRGALDMDDYRDALGERTRMVAAIHVSNALGTVNPVREMTALARERGIPVLLDGAQAAPHLPLDVDDLGPDFYVVAGHKAFGPTGIGVLWGRGEHLEAMPPYQGGGEMIRSVTFEESEFAPPPGRFEAGTPHIAGAIGLAAAFDYLEGVGHDAIARHEAELLAEATTRLGAIPEVRLVGTAPEKTSVVSFVVDGVHAHDVGTILDAEGVAVRAGHHCAQPLMDRFGVAATVRASFAFYNTRGEARRLADAVSRAVEIFR